MKKFLAHHPDGKITEHLKLAAAEQELRAAGGLVYCSCHPNYPHPITRVRKKTWHGG